MRFAVEGRSGAARAGKLEFGRGTVRTPCFMPVATNGCVKALTPAEVASTGARMLIANALILSQRPGLERIDRLGGVHGLIGWDGPVVTDSGGFQVVREGFFAGTRPDGIRFRSPFDGREALLTPEGSASMQSRLGSDIAMALDVCAPFDTGPEALEEAVDLTIDWARRFVRSERRPDQAAFPIVQGGIVQRERERCSKALAELDPPGYGIGGLTLGEPRDAMLDAVAWSVRHLPEDRPRYMMGLGSPLEIVDAVALGVDMFDSVFPTRNARHGTALTWSGPLDLSKGRYADDIRPVEPGCDCPCCRTVTRAHLVHLFRAREQLAGRLVTAHNLAFLQRVVSGAREAVMEGSLEAFRAKLSGWEKGGSPITKAQAL